MKLLYFDDFRLGVMKDDTVFDVSDIVEEIPHMGPHDLINGLIEQFDEYRDALETAASFVSGVPLSQVRVRAPLLRPATIDCMAVNYMEDGTRDEPAPINAFHKSPSAIIGPGDTMVLPDVPVSMASAHIGMNAARPTHVMNTGPKAAAAGCDRTMGLPHPYAASKPRVVKPASTACVNLRPRNHLGFQGIQTMR